MEPVGGSMCLFSKNVPSNSSSYCCGNQGSGRLSGVSGIWWRGARIAHAQGSSCPALGRVSDYLPSVFPWQYAWKFISLICSMDLNILFPSALSNSTMLIPLGSLPIDHTNLSWMNFSPSSHPTTHHRGRLCFMGISWCMGLWKEEKI